MSHGWDETRPDGLGHNVRTLTTTARLKDIYNASIVLTLQKDPTLYKDRGAFFAKDRRRSGSRHKTQD